MGSRPLLPETVLRGHSTDVQCLCFHPDKQTRLLYSGDASGAVRVWDLESTRARQIQAHSRDAGVAHLAFAAWASELVTQGRDGTVIRWALGDDGCPGVQLASFSTRSYHFCKMALSTTAGLQHTVAVAGEDPACPTIWDLVAGKKVLQLPKTAFGMAMALALPPTAEPLLVGGFESGHVAAWDLRAPKQPLASVQAHPEPIMALGACLTPRRHGKLALASAAQPQATPPSQELYTGAHSAQSSHVESSSGVTGDQAHSAQGTSAARGKESSASETTASASSASAGVTASLLALSLSPSSGSPAAPLPATPAEAAPAGQPESGKAGGDDSDAVWCMTGSADACVVTSRLVPSTGDFQVKHRTRLAEAGVADVHVRGDARVFACGGWDGRARVHHVRTGKPLAVLQYHRATVAAIAFDPHSSWVATGSRDSTVALWQVPLT